MEKGKQKINACLSLVLAVIFLAACGQKPEEEKKPPTEQALSELNVAVQKNPSDARAWFNRARYYLNKKDVGHAGDDIIKALELDTTQVDFFLMAADIHLMTNNSGKCKAALDKALLIKPDCVEALAKMAELYLYVKQNGMSNEYANQALDLDKQNTRALFIVGMNQKESGDTAKAIYAFQQILDLKPDDYDALMQVGILYSSRKNILCMEYFKRAAKLHPGSYEPYYNSGLYYQKTGNTVNALRDYRAALACNGRSAITWYNLGVLHLQNTLDLDQAVQCFSKALEFQPDYAEAMYMRGRAYEKKGNTEMARQDYTKALHTSAGYELPFEALKRLDRQ
jgi:tetratricopeptide (TPR) repeat protein